MALDIRSGMAVAMSDSIDGMTNDVPLVPDLMSQLREMIAGAILSIWDRQFDAIQGHCNGCRSDRGMPSSCG